MNRLKELRLEKNKLQSDIGKILGVSDRAVGNYETGKRDMSPETIIILANYFNVSTDYLLGRTDIRNNVNNIDDNEKQYYMCPVYGNISAGQPNWAEECIEGRLMLDPDLMGIVNPEEHFFLRVNGESMNKIVRNGAYALIHKQDMVNDGEIAVVLVNGYDATLKKFTRQGEMIILEPESTDDNFKTQVYDKTTPIKILGKYVGKMEINK
ncbi:MAG: helix-turn-helix domain-containing protein [Clostridia bacterium]|nr:helix-turn-helix domain-containing protein [Clostridia bacterium]